MKNILLLFTLSFILTSCDQLNFGYLTNETSEPISISLYFNNYETNKPKNSQNIYIENLIKDTLINDIKLKKSMNNIAELNFKLDENKSIELIFSTAPLRDYDVEFDALKIVTKNDKIELKGKSKILENFKAKSNKNKRYLIIEKR